MGLQFDTLVGVRSFHAGLLSRMFQDYPLISEQPSLPPNFEVFGVPFAQPVPPSFEFFEGTPVPRYWFHSEDRSQLVQFQNDRLLHNWIRTRPDVEYPRYENLRDKLVSDAHVLVQFLDENQLGSLKINQAEITYFNIIEVDEGLNAAANFHKVFRIWSNEYSDDQGRQLERGTIQFSYLLEDGRQRTIGRLHVLIQPGIRQQDMKQVIKFDLTVRGKPSGSDVSSALAFLDFGREAIVRAFASLTRKEMHELWGRNA